MSRGRAWASQAHQAQLFPKDAMQHCAIAIAIAIDRHMAKQARSQSKQTARQSSASSPLEFGCALVQPAPTQLAIGNTIRKLATCRQWIFQALGLDISSPRLGLLSNLFEGRSTNGPGPGQFRRQSLAGGFARNRCRVRVRHNAVSSSAAPGAGPKIMFGSLSQAANILCGH